MKFDKENNRLYVRQSWLGTYLTCPQRSRYELVMPNMRRGSDATAIGTGVHSAIEGYLGGIVDDLDAMQDLARTEVIKELEDETIRRTEISEDYDHMINCVNAMVDGWWNTIRHLVPKGGLIEHKFQAPLGVNSNGIELWLEGTMDYVSPDGTIWDWKTASRNYYAKEKQKQSHQATCYIAAARTLGLVDNGDEPTLFRFGVMIRNETPKVQIVTVDRGPNQVEWLRRQIASVAFSATTVPTHMDWPINDQHNLCSQKWCEFWSICKGVHWNDSSMEPPSQILPPTIKG
jgi:hypothetical protein